MIFRNLSYLSSFAKFCDSFVLRILCLKDLLNCTCLGVKLVHHYLFRVENLQNLLKGVKSYYYTCLGTQISVWKICV